jgi:Holliday junction resolvase RusA-like endonuclease
MTDNVVMRNYIERAKRDISERRLRVIHGEPAKPVTIILLGEPVPMAHRSASDGGRRYKPAKVVSATAALRLAAQEAMSGHTMLDEPVRLDLLCEVPIPRSWSRRKQLRAIIGELKPGGRPDLSNMLKLCEDAFKAVVWRDDSLVVEQYSRKVYGSQPKIVATIQVAK